MKKLNKLTLHQETVRYLNATELRDVVGGFITAITCACSGQPQTCKVSVCLGTCNPGEIPQD